MTEIDEAKQAIRRIHKIWYGNVSWLKSPELALALHRQMETIFNFAGITDTLVQNNPDKMSPSDFKFITGAMEE